MGLFHRSRDKDSHQAGPKHQFGFRKSFKKFTGAKSTSLAPEPLATSIIRPSNTSERSPCNTNINGTSASLKGSAAANESINTISPCRQVQVADGEPFPSGPDAKTDDQVVPIEELSNLHINKTDISSLKQDAGLDETDASSLKQDTGQRSIEVAQPDHIPCQYITSRPKTLWDRAYDALRSSNDPDKSDLIADYEGRVLQGITAKMSGRTIEPEEAYSDSRLDQTPMNKAVLDRAIEDALKQAEEKSLARSSIDKAGKLMLALQNFIGEAVKASPEASLVWAGVCLVLPLLTQPVIAAEAQRNGFTYVTSRIGFWTTLERQLANAGNWTESVQDEFITLYQHLLEFQVRTVLRFHQGGFARFVQDVSSNVWEQLIIAIKDQERLLHQDLQQYHNAHQSLTSDVLKQNSNASLESNAKFLEALHEMRDIVRKDAEKKLKKEEKECLRLFRLTDNQRDVTYEWYKSRVEKRVEGTCIWAVQHENFQNWLELKSGPLLITADPGCGKSVLSKYLIDQYLPQRCPTATICYFFFKDGDQNTVKQALCALLHQLFCQKPELIKHALEEYERNGEGVVGTTSALWGTFNNAICDENAGTIIIVLDALDECESTEFTRLVESLTVPRERTIKLFLTSRPYGDVVFPFEHGDMLDRFPRVRIPGETDDHSDKISTEINMAIRVRVDEFARRYRLNDQLKETLWAELCRMPHRTYLWVFLVFDHLKPLMPSMLKRTPQGFKTAIEELPRTVADAYERMLNRSGEAARVALRRALSVLLVAKRPLQVDEFKIVVNMESHITSFDELDLGEDDHDFEMRLRAMCGLFLSIHGKKVYFLHQTAREFLLAKSESSSALMPPYTWRHSISERQAHAELARICVRYIYILDPEVVHRDSDHWRILREYPFLVYSSDHWSHHLLNSDLDDDIGFLTTAMVLCKPGSKQFRTWTTACCLNSAGRFARGFSTSLHVAVSLGCNGLVRHLLRKIGAEEINTGHNESETTLLALAARYGHRDVIQLLIAAGAKVDVGWDKQTPLYEAVYMKAGNSECVTILLNYGASVDQLYAGGRTLLHVAARNDDAEIVEILADKGIDINATDSAGDTALLMCSSSCGGRSNDGIKLATVLIERGACLNIANKDGTTALMQAVDLRRWALAKLLIEKGADPNLRNCKGKLALHMLYYSDEEENTAVSLARTLVEKCVHLEAQDYRSFTPLHVAAAWGLVELVRLLFERGADLEATTHRGFTPLLLAVLYGNTKVLRFLIDSGANVEVTDNEGESPLFFAVARSQPQIVEMLLEFGANVEGTGKGPSPLKKAVEVIRDNLNTVNGILRDYEKFKERTSGLETGTKNGDLITADSPEMARLKRAWKSERAQRSLATHQILRRAVADTGIDGLDEEVETALDRAIKDVDRAMKDVDQALEEMKRRFPDYFADQDSDISY